MFALNVTLGAQDACGAGFKAFELTTDVNRSRLLFRTTPEFSGHVDLDALMRSMHIAASLMGEYFSPERPTRYATRAVFLKDLKDSLSSVPGLAFDSYHTLPTVMH